MIRRIIVKAFLALVVQDMPLSFASGPTGVLSSICEKIDLSALITRKEDHLRNFERARRVLNLHIFDTSEDDTVHDDDTTDSDGATSEDETMSEDGTEYESDRTDGNETSDEDETMDDDGTTEDDQAVPGDENTQNLQISPEVERVEEGTAGERTAEEETTEEGVAKDGTAQGGQTMAVDEKTPENKHVPIRATQNQPQLMVLGRDTVNFENWDL